MVMETLEWVFLLSLKISLNKKSHAAATYLTVSFVNHKVKTIY